MQQPGLGVRPRPRIETLADLIFGLSLSIGSIALIANPPKNSGEITTHILAFAYTFFVLITAWMIYTTYMSVLPVETRTVTFLNVGLLLLVAIVPYLLNGVEVVAPGLSASDVSKVQNYSSQLFALDLGGILIILATFAHVISLEEKKLVAPELVALFKNGRNRMAVLAVLTLISVAPQFWDLTFLGVPIRLYLWYPPLVSYWVGRAVRPYSRTYKIA
jgi:Endosomal/lysosomal potassium channel TMEM175